MKQLFYLILGLIALGLSYIGVILPGIPAIPFILLTIFFLSKSSERLLAKVEKSRLIGKIILKIKEKIVKPWFTWFVISQFLVSMIVAERLFINNYLQSLMWYLFTLILCIIFFIMIKKKIIK